MTEGQAPPDRSVSNVRELVDLRSRVLTYTKDFRASGSYTPPRGTQRERLAEGIERLLAGEAEKAGETLAPLGLRITHLTDAASGRRYDEVAATRSGAAEHWGRLYLNVDSALRWNVQVPHPVSDQDTESLGIRLLESAPGGALVLAGSHRRAGEGGAADVAHRADSAFHTIVVELQKRGVPSLQVHGFAASGDRPYEAVVSGGAARSTVGEASALADRMEAGGLQVCRGWSARCPLEGNTNAQGLSAQRRHAKFIHLELAPDARGNGSRAGETAESLTGLLSGWAKG
ncbi:hypothetical protein ACWCPF_05935 [Streptomyces sp. NPDC001858]